MAGGCCWVAASTAGSDCYRFLPVIAQNTLEPATHSLYCTAEMLPTPMMLLHRLTLHSHRHERLLLLWQTHVLVVHCIQQ